EPSFALAWPYVVAVAALALAVSRPRALVRALLVPGAAVLLAVGLVGALVAASEPPRAFAALAPAVGLALGAAAFLVPRVSRTSQVALTVAGLAHVLAARSVTLEAVA